MSNCRFCQNTLDDQGARWYTCSHCKVWVLFDQSGGQPPIIMESYKRPFNSGIYTFTVNYKSQRSYLENLFGDIVWETNSIIQVDPESVYKKIKTILIFL